MSKRTRKDLEEYIPEWKTIDRSLKEITIDDLKKLLNIVKEDFNDFISRKSQYKSMKLISMCLCQGAGLHYVDKTTGIRDFDVFMFFDDSKGPEYPPRARRVKDFGDDKFGKTFETPNPKNNHPEFIGRNIDILGRSIKYIDNYKKSIIKYLQNQETDTAYHLSRKAVVVLYPEEDIGTVLWKN